MARPRMELHEILKAISGVEQAYHQPPANVQMVYPCIVYFRDAKDTKFADNGPYLGTKRYQVTVIDRNPDSEIPDQVAQLPLCSFAQHFVTDNLHHDVFSLYF
jgi:hypothetical protein